MIIAHPGARSTHPVNGQLIMESSHLQFVHNILIAMPGSQLTVASFCRRSARRSRPGSYHCPSQQAAGALGGDHFGISEFYVEKGAQLCFSMVRSLSLFESRRSTPGATPSPPGPSPPPSSRTTASSTATTSVWSPCSA